MDYQIFQLINGFAGKFGWLDWLGIFFAVYFIYIWALFIASLWFEKKLRPKVYLAFVSALVSYFIVLIFKQLVGRPRPYQVLPVHLLIADTERGLSFPSGHAVVFFSLAFAFYNTKYFKPFFVLACICSLARVFVGVHYPSDILVGAIIGALTAWSLQRLFKKQFLG